MRRRLPAGVRMYTGDDFNYPELIAGDAARPQRCLARHLRCHRARRLSAALACWPRQPGTVPRNPGALRCAFAAHLRGAHAFLQDRGCIHGLAQRPPGTSPWWAGSRARARCRILPSCSGWPIRPACWRARLAVPPHEECWPARGRTDARLLPGSPLSINTATVRKQLRGCRCRNHRSLRPSRHSRHLPWRDQVGAAGLETNFPRHV